MSMGRENGTARSEQNKWPLQEDKVELPCSRLSIHADILKCVAIVLICFLYVLVSVQTPGDLKICKHSEECQPVNTDAIKH